MGSVHPFVPPFIQRTETRLQLFFFFLKNAFRSHVLCQVMHAVHLTRPPDGCETMTEVVLLIIADVGVEMPSLLPLVLPAGSYTHTYRHTCIKGNSCFL